ncbi:MAG: vitamin K epoxide reductase family protein [bacterium JZ-2024 1]
MADLPSADFPSLLLSSLFATGGWAISLFSLYHLRLPSHHSCPLWLRGICETLTHSRYYRILGIPNLYLAVGYFLLLSLFPVLCFFHPSLCISTMWLPAVFALIGTLFALYAQWALLFFLRRECRICLLLTSLSIFQLIFWLERILRTRPL